MSDFIVFPVEVFPEPLQSFATETAAALGCDPTLITLPMLSVLGASVGTSRSIELKSSWHEPPVIWSGLAARSGSLKSPAFDAATKPLRDIQTEQFSQYKLACAEHKLQLVDYERNRSSRGRAKSDDSTSAKPEAPVAVRYILSDATIEAIAPILEGNPRGLLLARDELSAWLRSFGQYKGGRGSDAAAWLELWRAGTLIVDRKSGEPRTIHVPRAAVSVCGTIQPGILRADLHSQHFESGLAPRLLLAQPPERAKRWSERTPSIVVCDRYSNLIRNLVDLGHVEGPRGPEALPLPLTAGARSLWEEFYNRNAERIQDTASDHVAAARAKHEAYCARFALIFALVADPGASVVSPDAMERAIILIEWFGHESGRVYARLGESEETRELRELTEWVERRGGSVSVRDLVRAHSKRYSTAEEAEAALNGLVTASFGRWETIDREAGGWPSRRFILHATEASNSDTRPKFSEKTGRVSDDSPDAQAQAAEQSDASDSPTTEDTSNGEWGEL